MAGDLDELWDRFLVENDAVFDALLDLHLADEFPQNLEIDLRALIYEIKTLISNQGKPETTPLASVSATVQHSMRPQVKETDSTNDVQVANIRRVSNKQSSLRDTDPLPYASIKRMTARLPDLPLPTFDGDLHHWPVFRDRFVALVDNRTDLPSVEKFYYLLGCLESKPREVIKGITVSNDTYDLPWSALSDRFDKPRKLASSIVDQLLAAPTAQSETLPVLNGLISTFDEKIALLNSLNIRDLSSFLLFSFAFKCFPLFSRQLFESENTEEYPSFAGLIKIVKARIHVLDNADASSATSSCRSAVAPLRNSGPRCKNRTALVTASKPRSKIHPAKSNKCPCFSGIHRLADCAQFLAASVDQRYETVCTHCLCMVCFSDSHMSYACPSSCTICSCRYHALLHREASAIAKPKSGRAQVILLGSRPTPAVLLGTALVHVWDISGSCQVVRALIDSASQISAVTHNCCARLGLRPKGWILPVTGLAGQPVPDVKGAVQLQI